MASPYLDLPIRSESEARSNITMLDTIRAGAARLVKVHVAGCPWCGSDPLPPANILGRYVLECENDECVASVSVAGDSAADAVAKWNRRA